MENNPYHIPVLLHVATDALIQNKNGCYVDLTLVEEVIPRKFFQN